MKRVPRLLYHIEDCHGNGIDEVSAVEVIEGPEKSYAITGSIYCPSVLFWQFSSDCPLTGNLKNPSDFSEFSLYLYILSILLLILNKVVNYFFMGTCI